MFVNSNLQRPTEVRSGRQLLLVISLLALLAGLGLPVVVGPKMPLSPPLRVPSPHDLGSMPLSFEPILAGAIQAGQTDRSIHLMAHFKAGIIYLTTSGVRLSLR